MQIREAYNKWADQYDSNENRTRDLEKSVAKEYYAKVPMQNVLELGCGTGLNTELLSVRAEQVLGVDFSEKMLEQAKARVNNGKVRFEQFDLQDDWPLQKDTFDFISSSLVLEHIQDLKPLFQKCSAALQSGGYLYICEYHPVKQFSGSKPRFELNGSMVEVTAYVHRFTDYVSAANKSGLETLSFSNHYDIEPKPGKEEIPRLISFLFKKP